jgi:TnpA family transposase
MMGNTLDVFKAQQQAIERVHVRLTEVAALVASLKAQVDELRLGQELRQTLEAQQAWLANTNELLQDVRRWGDGELRQARRTRRWRRLLPFAFALAASAATGAGLVWAWHPYAAEFARLQAQAELAKQVESRVAAMTAAERQQFERLMKLPKPRER